MNRIKNSVVRYKLFSTRTMQILSNSLHIQRVYILQVEIQDYCKKIVPEEVERKKAFMFSCYRISF